MTAVTQKCVMMQAQTCVSKCECRIHQFSRGQALLQVIDCRRRKAHNRSGSCTTADQQQSVQAHGRQAACMELQFGTSSGGKTADIPVH
jgi:hypothetical protein